MQEESFHDSLQPKKIHEEETNDASHRKQLISGLEKVSLRQLRERNRQTENAINAVKSKIHYMKNKEEKAVKKVLNVRRKLQSLEQVRHKANEHRQQSIEEKQREAELAEQKSEFNKLIKDHLRYNKKIVTTLLNHKIQEDVKAFKDKKQQLDMLYHIQKDNINEDNAERANRVRSSHIEAHQKRKLYFLERLKQFKGLKEKRLKEEIRERERQESMIMELQEKERALLERLSVSERFRMKCQAEYEEAKEKYHSFYEAGRRSSRQDEECSMADSKAQIFIS